VLYGWLSLMVLSSESVPRRYHKCCQYKLNSASNTHSVNTKFCQIRVLKNPNSGSFGLPSPPFTGRQTTVREVVDRVQSMTLTWAANCGLTHTGQNKPVITLSLIWALGLALTITWTIAPIH